MPSRSTTGALLVVLSLTCRFSGAQVQQAVPRTPADQPAARPATKPAPPANGSAPAAPSSADAAKKAEILNSQRWRRAIFELGEWLNTQKIYSKEQVAEIKANFNVQVAHTSAAEVQATLNDLDAKFQIMETPEAQDARAWMGQYLSYLSNSRRDQILKEVPNVVTMSASQLSQELLKIERKRASIERDQAVFNQGQQVQANAVQQARAANQRAMASQESMPAGSFSPYRSSNTSAKPFEDVRPNVGIQYYVNPRGGVGMIFAPGSF